jgi:ATP-dependent helicase/nuclease subunit A
VHGAKGLEASVVFLVDTTSSPADTQRLKLIHLPQGNAASHAPGVVVWAGKKADDPAAVATARATMVGETEDEYRRLLYVAMTRAADRLIVGGCMPGNMNSVRRYSWYDLIVKGLANSGLHEETIERPDGGTVKRYSRLDDVMPATGAAAARATTVPLELPSWLRAPASPETAAAHTLLRPSDPAEGEARIVRTGESDQLRIRARQRGTLVHRLLQSLPELAAERRRDAALGYLARNAGGWSEDERNALAERVLALIGDARFAAVFAAGSRAEVSIVGRLDQPGRPLVSGQIDRLVVTPSEILIVDYKTNQSPPGLAAEAPKAYVRQLALYRAVLQKIYPQRAVRTALLWTETLELMEISSSALDAALASAIPGDGRA